IVSINIDDEDELADEYDVTSIPCLVVFKDGAEFERSVGFRQKEDVESLIGE
ncbi:MAG: thiol reductase thioredoxin, partial [Clostridia bacterium]|nr:thiol reductase thioredoxin [Clostridia bacterium]